MSSFSAIKEYEIHYYQVGFNKQASFTTFVNLFQDIFVYQSENIGAGFNYFYDKSLTWMVSKWDIKILKYPVYGEKIKVKMSPISSKKFYMYVKYQVLNKNGEIISEAISLWILINTTSGRPCKIDNELYERYGLCKDDNITISIDKINTVKSVVLEKVFNVGHSDIDTNGHVNNVKYISWALNTVPKYILKDYKLTRVKVNYKKNILDNEIIFSEIETIENLSENIIKCLHKIYTKDNTTLTLLESFFEKISSQNNNIHQNYY